jgi:hypothetical protein
MFLIPAGMMFGAPVSAKQWLLWNQLPVTLGNIVSGALFTGAVFYITYYVRPVAQEKGAVVNFSEPVATPSASFAQAAGSEAR